MEEKSKNKRRKGDPTPSTDGGQKEHKENYRKYMATVEDIKAFLCEHIMLRHNVVTGRTECHLPDRDPWEEYDGSAESAMKLLQNVAKRQERVAAAEHASVKHPPSSLWQPINDRILNSLWRDMSEKTGKKVNADEMYRVIKSDFVPDFHPFRYYLDHLPPWNGDDYIAEMSVSVRVRDAGDQMRFYEYLKKWLVAMVAGWLDEAVVNNVILVLIGEQGSYKTTWFSHVLPPELRQYFFTKTNSSRMGRDDLLVLSQYALMCCEELDTMSGKELNQLKAAVTMPSVDERAPYDRFPEHRPHIASFCGTGNNVQFLGDATGNRRWLPFEVESIDSPRDHPFNYEGIYAQAYALYRGGEFRYWFSQQEIQQLASYNRQFEAPRPEVELISRYYRRPEAGETGEFVSATEILQAVGGSLMQKLSVNKVAQAMADLGYERMRSHAKRGYLVVAYSAEEIKARQRMLASDARQEGDTGDAGDTAF